MTDLSTVEDDDLDLGELADGEIDEGGQADGDEGQTEGDAEEGEDDAGQDEGSDEEGDASGTASGDVTPPKRRSRANDRIRTAVERATKAEQKAADFERRLNEIERQRSQPTPAELEAARRAEEERLALMTPEQRIDYRFAQQEQRHQQEIHRVRLETRISADKAAFESVKASNPTARKYAAEVEAAVAAEAAKGMLVDRMVAFQFILGKHALERINATSGKQKANGARRVNAQQTRPGRAGGDQQGDRRGQRGDDSEAALERRLGNVKF